MKEMLKGKVACPETEYFYKMNKKLIDEKRQKLDKDEAEQAKREKQNTHWMKCPKCGHDMNELELHGIKVDRCTDCSGIYFDNGELELLLEAQKPEGFLAGLKKVFG